MDGALHVSGMQIAMMIVSFVFIIAMMVVLLGRYRRDEDLSRTLIWGLVIFMGTNAILSGIHIILKKTDCFLFFSKLGQALILSAVFGLSFVIISFFVMKSFVKKHLNDNTPIMMALGFIFMNVFQTALHLINSIVLAFAINKGETAKFIGGNISAESLQDTIDYVIALKPMNYIDLSISLYGEFIVYTVILIIFYRILTANENKMKKALYSVPIVLLYPILCLNPLKVVSM